MPLVDESADALPEKPLLEKVNDSQPLIARDTYKSSVVDTRYTSVASLLKYVEGSPWPVEYFNQLKNSSEGTNSLQVDQHAVYQQYLHIVDMSIKVTQALDYSTDETTHEKQLIGTANMPTGIIPNVGDAFVADMGDGREGIFNVTEAKKQTDLKDAVYEITYTFMGASDTARVKRDNLLTKVVRKLFYRQDYLSHGKKVLLASEEVNFLEVLNKQFNVLAKTYISKFWNRTFKCFCPIIADNNESYIFDPYINKCLVSILDNREFPEIGATIIYITDEAKRRDDITILDLLMRYDVSHFHLLANKMWNVGTSKFSRWPVYNGIYHSGLSWCTYPKYYIPEITETVDTGGSALYELAPLSLMDIFGRTELGGFLDEIPEDPDGQNDAAEITNLPPLFFSVNKDDYYILSSAFYTDKFTSQSNLELIISNVIRRKSYNLKYLVDIVKDFPKWSAQDQFYLCPVLLLLIKNAIHYQ